MARTGAFLFCVLLLAIVPAKAQTNQQWTIVATTETAPAAVPVQYDDNGNPINCTGQNPDSTSSGACYNPLTFTFDIVAPSSGSFGPTAAAVLSTADGFNLLSLTNYAGSQDGGVTSIQVEVVCLALCGLGLEEDTLTVTVTNQDGSTFIFTGTPSAADPVTAAFTSLGGSSGLDSGTASIYRENTPPEGEFDGSFENTNADSIDITFAGAQSSFSLNPVTVSPASGSNVCFTDTFSSSDALATSYYAGYDGSASGDVTAFVVGDGNGNAIYMQATPDGSFTGTFEDPDDLMETEYVTFYVLESTNSACPAGLAAYDTPFRRTHIVRPPLRFQRIPIASLMRLLLASPGPTWPPDRSPIEKQPYPRMRDRKLVWTLWDREQRSRLLKKRSSRQPIE